MSAIVGIWHLNGDMLQTEDLQKMQEQVSQYGRDQQKIEVCSNIGLGCCLAGSGLDSPAGIPVYIDESQGILLAADAQIYNQSELLNDCGLRGHEEISAQQLLLEAYRKWGEDCPRHINGDFAFAVFEKQKKQLFIARDHLGVRPLFFFYNRTTFAFATDYRALLALPFVDRKLDEVKLYALLSSTYHIAPERTYFEQIKSLPQAHTLRVDEKGIQQKKYWTPGADGKIPFKTEEEYAQALYSLVDNAVKLRVNAARAPIGAELSGGLDSSVITILASRQLRKENRSLIPYSWSPPFNLVEKQAGDERELIDSICRQEDLACIYNDQSDPEMGPGSPRLRSFAGTEKVLCRELQVLSSRGVRHVLSGWGGDQGISHRTNLLELLREGYWKYFLRESCYETKGNPLRFLKLLLSITVLRFLRTRDLFDRSRKGKPDILKPEFVHRVKKSCPEDRLYFNVNPVIHIESGNIQTRTELAARVGAAYDVQYLFPFLDYRVMDFAMSIPRYLFYKKGKNRYIYRKAFEGILPRAVSQTVSKQDIAAAALRSKMALEKPAEEKRISLNRINRNLFSAYVDWPKLQKELKASDLKGNSAHARMLQKEMSVCCHIQQILEETDQRC